MNTLKRKLTAILLTFAMLFSLMPSLPQAAEAANGFAENEYIQLDYAEAYEGVGDDILPGNLTVKVQDVDGNQLGDLIEITDFGRTTGLISTITVKAEKQSEYELESLSPSKGTFTETEKTSTEASFYWTDWLSGEAELVVTLCEPHQLPQVDDTIEGYGNTRMYRIYDEQVLKMLYLAGDTDISEDTIIEQVKPVWVNSLDTLTETNKALIDENREHDYLDNSYSDGDVDNVQPNNIRKIEITYKNGEDGQSQTRSVYAKDLRYVKATLADVSGGAPYYKIESNNDSIHIVYFYNETGLASSNDFYVYAIRMVEDGNCIGKLPDPPIYDENVANEYKFVNWEIDSWKGDGATGEAFLPTTIVDKDMTVYAHKVSSELGGTWIDVRNDDNEFLERIAQLYNEANNTNINPSDIRIEDNDGFGISVYDINNNL